VYPPSTPRTLLGRVDAAVGTLSPACFALVMATGIVSIGLHLDGPEPLSLLLLLVAAAALVVLLGLTGWRLVSHRDALVEDFTRPSRGFSFYSAVAAANVVGVRTAGAGHPRPALWLLVVASIAWLLRGYALPWSTRLGPGERSILAAANGTWFLWSVSCQSIAVAAAGLAEVWGQPALKLLAVLAWAVGLFLYLVEGLLVVVRLVAFPVSPADLDPPYWVALGAAAIAVLACTRVLDMPAGAVTGAVHEVARGAALLLWAVASWLLPGLVAMGWWRHVTHRVPLRYGASSWCVVFPLGMYAVASTALAHTLNVPLLHGLGTVMLWVAFAACLALSGWMIVHVNRTVLRR
jgi:tellurite resistance protein TehA-like permease